MSRKNGNLVVGSHGREYVENGTIVVNRHKKWIKEIDPNVNYDAVYCFARFHSFFQCQSHRDVSSISIGMISMTQCETLWDAAFQVNQDSVLC